MPRKLGKTVSPYFASTTEAIKGNLSKCSNNNNNELNSANSNEDLTKETKCVKLSRISPKRKHTKSESELEINNKILKTEDINESQYFKSNIKEEKSPVSLKTEDTLESDNVKIKSEPMEIALSETFGQMCIKKEETHPKSVLRNKIFGKLEQVHNIKPKMEGDSVLWPNMDPFAAPETYWKPVWIPPKSPHNLLEESLYENPWGLLVATIFLNKTSCSQAKPMVEQFLKEFPTPGHVLEKQPSDLEKYFEYIGLKKRSFQIWRMSHDFIYKKWKNVGDLHGIGKYGEDAFRIFCLGDLSCQPSDRFLKIYHAFAKLKEKEDGCSQREAIPENDSFLDESLCK